MSELPPVPPAPPPAAPPPPPPAGASSDRTMMLVLAYLGILALIPLLIKKDDDDVQWHSKNGLVLFGAWFVFFCVLVAMHFIPIVGCIAFPVNCILWLCYLALGIVLILKAVNGERMRMPLITDIAEKL